MSSARDDFLTRVRQAVAQGNRPGSSAAIDSRNGVGYQGAGADPVRGFCEAFRVVGGQPHVVTDGDAAVLKILEVVRARTARKVLVGGALPGALKLEQRFREMGVEAVSMSTLSADVSRQEFFAADIGISGVDYLIAETGSIALFVRPENPRSLSLLPPVHIAVATREQIVPDLFDLFDRVAAVTAPGLDGHAPRPVLPWCLTLITGPSKTGDIELRLVTGVHGPGEVHVVLIAP